MLRLFVGIPIPSDVLKKIPQKRLAGLPGKKIPSPNWHITLKFLGGIEANKVEEIENTLRELFRSEKSQPIELAGLDAFSSLDHASTIWIGISQGQQHLSRWAQMIDKALAKMGIPLEEKPYVPHLSIRRIKPARNIVAAAGKVLVKPISMHIKEICLYQSHTEPTGAVYEVLKGFPLE